MTYRQQDPEHLIQENAELKAENSKLKAKKSSKLSERWNRFKKTNAFAGLVSIPAFFSYLFIAGMVSKLHSETTIDVVVFFSSAFWPIYLPVKLGMMLIG